MYLHLHRPTAAHLIRLGTDSSLRLTATDGRCADDGGHDALLAEHVLLAPVAAPAQGEHRRGRGGGRGRGHGLRQVNQQQEEEALR